MQTKTIIIISIVLGLFLLSVGVVIGLTYQKDMQGTLSMTKDCDSLINILSSKSASLFSISGQIQSIDKKSITLLSSDESITVDFAENMQVNSVAKANDGRISYQPYLLSQVKKDYNVSVDLKLLPDGFLQVQSMIILPFSN